MNTISKNCDHQRIDEFLNSNRVGLEDKQLLEHLNTCTACRQYLESNAADPECWISAGRLLQPGEFDHASTDEYSLATRGAGSVDPPAAIQSVLDCLSPTEEPSRLGRLGTYEVSGVIGAGGMGVVLKAVDPALDRVVAIKVMAPHLANNGTARKRFSREAKAAAAVLHPNVVPIHSVSSDEKIPYLVMAYIRGGSLQKRLDLEGPLSTVEILRIGSQVATGLAAAHEQGLVHRDVKPENIMLEEGVERITLTDFGLARTVDDASVTQPGTIAGTPQYMSPEQTRGEPIDQQSDLFSLGCVLYALCTGRPPFPADSSYAVMRKISDESPMPIRELNPEMPEWLCAIISKLMAKDKADRFRSANKVHELLESCLGHAQQPTVTKLPEIPRVRPSKNQQRSIRILIGVLAMSAVVACVLFGLSFVRSAPQNQTNEENNQPVTPTEILGHGYTRNGQHVLFDGKRIDQEGSHDLTRFARTLSRELKLASNVDAASFKALSEEYTKDKDMVYYKWISPDRFWVVELPEADPASFESVAFNLAKDHKLVWWYGDVLKGIDPKTLEVVHANFVWKDRDSVWYQHEQIVDADPKTFTHIGQAYYRDKNRVYWGMTPLDGADPTTFRSFRDDIPYGVDKNFVWRGTETIPKMDPATFGVVHQSVYKDKTGVYCNGLRVPGVRPETTRKLADLNDHLTALLTDGENHFVFVALWNEVYRIESRSDGLHVSRDVWEGRTRPEKRLGNMRALLTEQGWLDLSAPESELWGKNYYEQREVQTLTQHKNEFKTAWEIITGSEVAVNTDSSTTNQVQGGTPNDRELLQGAWIVDSATEGGKRVLAADKDAQLLGLQIEGNTFYKIESGDMGRWHKYQMEIDSTKSPKTIDLIISREFDLRVVGIYEVKNGVFRVCFNDLNKFDGEFGGVPDNIERSPLKRPTKFAAPAGSKNVLLECRPALGKIDELLLREDKGLLSKDEENQLIDLILECQGDRRLPWSTRLGDVIEKRWIAGKLDRDLWEQYTAQFVSDYFDVRVRPRIVIGTTGGVNLKLMVQDVRCGSGKHITFQVQEKSFAVRIRDKLLVSNNMAGNLGTLRHKGGHSCLGRSLSFGQETWEAIKPGRQTITYESELSILKSAAPKQVENPEICASRKVIFEAETTFLPAGQTTVTINTDPLMKADVDRSIKINRIETGSAVNAKTDNKYYSNIRLDIQSRPIDIAFDIILKDGDNEYPSGSFTSAADGKTSWEGMAYLPVDLSGKHVDVILRPAPGKAELTVDLFEIWGEEIVLKNVLVKMPGGSGKGCDDLD